MGTLVFGKRDQGRHNFAPTVGFAYDVFGNGASPIAFRTRVTYIDNGSQ
jgi:hypothetical protein